MHCQAGITIYVKPHRCSGRTPPPTALAFLRVRSTKTVYLARFTQPTSPSPFLGYYASPAVGYIEFEQG